MLLSDIETSIANLTLRKGDSDLKRPRWNFMKGADGC